MLRMRGEVPALQATTFLLQGFQVDLDSRLALMAARVGLEHDLPLADSIVYATARAHEATLWTQDTDFKTLEGVRYVPKA
jgi:predicted nucleic acid-binding protein